MSRRTLTKLLPSLACTILLITSIGCNPGSLTSPVYSTDVVTNPNFIRIFPTSDGASFIDTEETVTVTVSAELGGTVSHGRFTLDFPAGALDKDTEITITSSNDGTLGVELSPHGIQFNHPVTLSMDLAGTSAENNSSSLSILYLNEATGHHERMPKVHDNSDLVTELSHFSKYDGTIDLVTEPSHFSKYDGTLDSE